MLILGNSAGIIVRKSCSLVTCTAGALSGFSLPVAGLCSASWRHRSSAARDNFPGVSRRQVQGTCGHGRCLTRPRHSGDRLGGHVPSDKRRGHVRSSVGANRACRTVGRGHQFQPVGRSQIKVFHLRKSRAFNPLYRHRAQDFKIAPRAQPL